MHNGYLENGNEKWQKKNIQMKQKPNRDNRKIRRRRRRKELLRGAMDNFLFPRMHLDFQSGGKKYPFVSCRLLHQCFLRFIESVAKFLYSLSDFFKKVHQVFLIFFSILCLFFFFLSDSTRKNWQGSFENFYCFGIGAGWHVSITGYYGTLFVWLQQVENILRGIHNEICMKLRLLRWNMTVARR